MPAILKGLSGTYAGNQMEIGSQPTIIGCDPLQANLIIPKTRIEISERHVSIAFDAARQVVILIDMSREGTYLMSGERIPRDQPYALQSGMQFYLGNTGNSFEVEVTRGGAVVISNTPIQFAYPSQQQAEYYLPAYRHSGFWKRFVAKLVDWFILFISSLVLQCVLALVLAIILAADSASGDFRETTDEAKLSSLGLLYMLMLLFYVVLPWLYSALMESSRYQGTLGKMAMGIKVTDLEGHPISFARATGRYFAGALSVMTLCIGYMMAGWTERKQALHDMIAECLVEDK